METISEHRCFGGVQGVYRHQSQHTSTPIQFSVFVLSAAAGGKCPVLWFLSGLTCTDSDSIMDLISYWIPFSFR